MQDFLNKLKHFMDDRYGVDDLSCALGALGVIIALLGALLKVGLFTWIAIIVIVLAIVRAISKNFPARERENDQFRQLTSKAPALDGLFDKLPFKHGAERMARAGRAAKKMLVNRKTTMYFRCKNCGQILSVPRGKGRILITCPKCGCKAEKRS